MVARAVNGLDGACNAIGGGGLVVAIGGCPMHYALDNRRVKLYEVVRGCPAMAPVAYTLLLTPGPSLGLIGGPRLDKVKPPDKSEGLELFAGWIGRGGGFIAGDIAEYSGRLYMQVFTYPINCIQCYPLFVGFYHVQCSAANYFSAGQFV